MKLLWEDSKLDFTEVDHCHTLQFVVDKYTSSKDGMLAVAFMDLRPTFDLVPRQRLWDKAEEISC